MALEFYTLQKY